MVNSKIVVITHGRFHSFDLAEQLQAAGRLAAIYTGYPKFKLRNTGVDPRLIRSFPWLHVLQLASMRVPRMPAQIVAEIGWRAAGTLAAYAAHTLPECGVVTALSGSGLKAGALIKQRGGVYVCDRGSTHIQWVERTLNEEYASLGLSWPGIDQRPVRKELEEYALADAITVPSRFAMGTFVEMGVPAEKLRLIPYGVNLRVFRRSEERAKRFRVLFVGQLSVRKGLHYLLQAFARAKLPNAELVLVGAPTADTHALLNRFHVDDVTLTGALPREGVVREMSRASVLVLPSIEEGLAMVQAQALACGCPVIATTNTGAHDLFANERDGYIVAPRDVDAIVERLTRLYRDPELLSAMSASALDRVERMGGWDSYGRMTLKVFDELLAAKGLPVARGGE